VSTNKTPPYQDSESLVSQIKVLSDQVKKLTAGELHQYELQEKLDSQLKTQEEIIRLGNKLQPIHDEKEIAILVTEALVESFEYEKAVLFIRDESSREFNLAGMDGYYGECFEKTAEESINDLIKIMDDDDKRSDILVQHDMPRSVMGMDNRVILVCRLREGPIRSFVVFGNSRDKASYQRPIEEQDRTLWNTILRITSSALENAILYKQLEREREDLRSARDNMKKLNDELESRVIERTSELIAAEEKYRSLVERANDGIVIAQDGILKYANPRATELCGYTVEEMMGSPMKGFFSPEEWAVVLDHYTRRLSGSPVEPIYETAILHKKGHKVEVEFNAGVTHYEKQPAILLIIRDITERKRIDEQLIKIQKFESIGTLAGGIAHDFNNLLTGILGNISMAKLYARDDKAIERLTKSEIACDHAKELTSRLITFSRGGEPLRKISSIAPLLKDIAQLSLSGSNVSYTFSLPDDLWSVEIDAVQIRQSLHNIIMNAREAMPEGGIITIIAENTMVNQSDNLPLKEGLYVKLSIKDNGKGISPENLGKIFDPYFTTKNLGSQKGMGLGLSVSYSIIKKHNGYITVESVPGDRTIFHVYLPALEGSA
jgi:PAS domain S-box-containing protein